MKNLSLFLVAGICLMSACQVNDYKAQMQEITTKLESSPNSENLVALLKFCLFTADDPKTGIAAYEKYHTEADPLIDSLHAALLCKQAGKETAIDKKLHFIQKGLSQFDKNRAKFPESTLVLVYQVSTLGHFPKELGAGERTLQVAQELLDLKKKNGEVLDKGELEALESSFAELSKTYPDLKNSAETAFSQLKELKK